MEYLSRADEILLLAVFKLGEEATGVAIIREIRKTMGKMLSLGSLWVSLDILAKKGLVSKSLGDPMPRRGGRSRLFYRVTEEGMDALKRVRELNAVLWKKVPLLVKSSR